MADKRISQLVDRGTVVNNDVIPIVVSGASTTNKATISSIQTFMQGNLDLGVTSVGITLGSTGTDVNVSGSPVTSSGNITINFPTASATNRGLLSSANWTTFNNKVSSVGLSMPSAFAVANSPITGSGTIAVTGAGTVAQYIRGDGSLADFPSGGGGGGASVNYYLNGSVSQGSIGGIGYSQMSKTPILGAGTDFTIASTNYIASFITDAGNPALLEIPAGNWNFESYFSASSGGGSPSFYIELYKVNSGGTATLIASSLATPELISFGTSISPYFSPLAVPATVLTITDRLAVRYFVNNSGRTITLHTENSHLCQIITTFTTGLTALNGLTAQVQNFATGTSGTDFAISSTSATHTFNLPDASASARGVVTTGTQTFAGYKIFNGTIGVNNDIQLATNGTALNTFIKNINAVGLTSIGSNGFGFNNSNNIYFSGSSKGGGIFAFSNTGNQTYTLQDASGTLAFTSDLSAYLPLAGGTMTGAIVGTTSTFTNSGAGIGLGVTNSGSGDGLKITHSAGRAFNIQSSGAGFGVIINNETASTSAPFTIQKQGANKVAFTDAGAADFSSSVTASSFVKSSGTSAQFLKADGSVDSSTYLTTGSAASTYLPLAGGTLTGALNGTSASFTGAVSSSSKYTWGSSTTGTTGQIATDGTNNYLDYIGNLIFRGAAASNTLITFTSTGAATFSSSIVSTGGVMSLQKNGSGTVGSGPYYTLYNAATTDGILFQLNASNNIDFWGLTSNSFTASPVITFTRAGAATFSSSVSVKGGLTIVRSNTSESSIISNEGNLIYNARDNFNHVFQSNGSEVARINTTGAATFSSSVGVGAAPTGTYGTLSVSGGISIKNDNSAKLEIGRYSAGVSNSYIKLGPSSNSLRFTNNTDAADLFIIENGGNVGIGTASPKGKFDVFRAAGDSGTAAIVISNGEGGGGRNWSLNTEVVTAGDFAICQSTTNGGTPSPTGANTKFYITSSGNSVIGGTTAGTSLNTSVTVNNPTAGNYSGLIAMTADTQRGYYGGTSTGLEIGVAGSGFLGIYTSGTERMRITSGGDVLIGTTSNLAGGSAMRANISADDFTLGVITASGATKQPVRFVNGTTAVGSITTTTTSTSYNMVSDYRLKEDFQEIQGLEKVLALKVYDYKWKSEESRMDGVVAHELQEILPYAVSGEKDGDEMQGVDYSKIVPILIKAIQEQQEQINQLKSQIK